MKNFTRAGTTRAPALLFSSVRVVLRFSRPPAQQQVGRHYSFLWKRIPVQSFFTSCPACGGGGATAHGVEGNGRNGWNGGNGGAAVAAPPHTGRGGNGRNGRERKKRRGGGGGSATAHGTGTVEEPRPTGQHGQAGEWPSLSDGTGDWSCGRGGGSGGGGSATAYRTGLLVS